MAMRELPAGQGWATHARVIHVTDSHAYPRVQLPGVVQTWAAKADGKVGGEDCNLGERASRFAGSTLERNGGLRTGSTGVPGLSFLAHAAGGDGCIESLTLC